MASRHHNTVPTWTWLLPVLASLLLAAKFAGVVSPDNPAVLVAAAVLLGCSVFAAVHHAEVLALRLGEPFGSILLAVAVTTIEVGLIVSVFLSGAPGSDTVARDTIYSAVMIVLNGIVGLCLVLGASQYREQSFQLQGASAALAVLAPLAVFAMVLPNYTARISGPFYSPFQLEFVGLMSLTLYSMFVFVQTVRHRDYFLDVVKDNEVMDTTNHRPPALVALASLGLLLVALASVVLLGKVLSKPVESVVSGVGLPQAVVGVVIATIVLLPEAIASIRAAISNRLQNSLNLALGSAIASIGLTIPVVAIASLIFGKPLLLGLEPEYSLILLLTLFMSALTLGTGRTTVLEGAVHLVIFAAFLLFTAVP